MKTVIEMAREAGFTPANTDAELWEVIERFAAMICKAERERCATQVDHILKSGGGTYGDYLRAMK